MKFPLRAPLYSDPVCGIVCLLMMLITPAPAWAQGTGSDQPNASERRGDDASARDAIGAVDLDQDDDSLARLFSFTHYSFRDFTAYWDNDGTIPNLIDDTDRYYTNANGFEFSFDPGLSEGLASRLAISEDPGEQRFGVGLAIKQRIYTAADITLTNPPAREHPYAGYLALAFSFQRADDHTHEHFGLDLGLTGHTAGAEGVQKWIHNTFPDEDDPKGWGTQLPTEPTINLAYTRTWKSDRADIGGLEMELLPELGFDAGSVLIDARSAMTLRIGKHLPSDFGPASLLGHRDHTVRTNEASESSWSLYAYAKLGVDAIARDIFIDGTAFSGSRSAQREPLVATFTFGLVFQYESFYVGWSQNTQTERFDTQPDSQTWGSIVLGCSFAW